MMLVVNEDQVVRLLDFEAAHCDITITRPDYASGARLWSAHRSGRALCAEHELSALLDQLGKLLADPASVSE